MYCGWCFKGKALMANPALSLPTDIGAGYLLYLCIVW